MPLTLTTPKQTGDLDPVASSYDEAKIVRMTYWPNRKYIELMVEYGNTVAGEWVSGLVPQQQFLIMDQEGDPQYTDLIAATSVAADEVYYAKVAEHLYQWLVDQGHFAGTVA